MSKQSGELSPDDPRHGTANAYSNWGCRCQPCVQTWSTYQKVMRSKLRATLPPDDPRHGTSGGYRYWRCRCDICKAFEAKEKLRLKRSRKSYDAPHGTLTGYTNWGCRCQGCREAMAEYDAIRRSK